MRTLETIQDLNSTLAPFRREGKRIGFVPTMGAFHEGHLSLMRRARKECDVVVVSIFVNPLQFSAGEDYDRYPRNLPNDSRLSDSVGVDILYVPSVAEMYAKGFRTFVDQDELPTKLCGEHRPGHFRGVMTVVAKLFNICRPHVVYFGMKDYQQALIIRRMVVDLNCDIDVRTCPTIREEDGLAMSSRNVYLGPKQRKDASYIYKSLLYAKRMIDDGETSSTRVISEVRRILRKIKGSRVDYIQIINQDTLEPVREIKGKTLIAVAIRVGKARLIDNLLIQ
jgi:pantoate--beta-alanine ligase